MSGSIETGSPVPHTPPGVEQPAGPAGNGTVSDPEALPPETVPVDDSNRILIDEDGPF